MNVNDRNPRTLWTPLHWCCFYGDFRSVAILLHHGANSYLPDYDGNFPIDLAGRSVILQNFILKPNCLINNRETLIL
jgi:ankyrin repeat protein